MSGPARGTGTGRNPAAPAGGGPAGPGPAGRAAGAFRERYGHGPEGVWHAPGRANLIGEHTDYNEGWVLPFALDRGVYVAGSRRRDRALEVSSAQVPGGAVRLAPASLRPGAVTGWTAYPAGVAWALREAGHDVGGADLVIDSDLPQGAGLSSSAALECAVALALTGLHGLTVPRGDLAAIARRAENDVVGVPSGIMDQSAALLSQAGHALLLDCRSGRSAAVPLTPATAGLALLIIDTRARHTLTDGRYSLRRHECEAAAAALGVASLRDATGPTITYALADPVLARRARHVITENRRVHDTVAALRTGDYAAVGALLRASHASLRDDFEISWPEADAAVGAAESAGSPGARMMGGGFGGSVIALVPADSPAARAAVAGEFARHGWAAPRFYDAPPSPSARRLR